MTNKQLKFLKIMNNNLSNGKITKQEYESNLTLKNLLKIKNEESINERKIVSRMKEYCIKWGFLLMILISLNSCSKSVDKIPLTPINRDSSIYYNGKNKPDSVWQIYGDTIIGKVISDSSVSYTNYQTVCADYSDNHRVCNAYNTIKVDVKYILETIKYDSIDYNLPIPYQPFDFKNSIHYTIIDYLKNYNGKDSIGTIFKKPIFRWKKFKL